MEHAIWNNKRISAFDIEHDYALEKQVREASVNKELYCPDPLCQNRILHYRHGDIRTAHFAHTANSMCDYAQFDKDNNKTIKNICRKLYEYFNKLGFDTQTEVKILKHHYTHLLITLSPQQKLAIELGTKRTTVNQMNAIIKDYNKIGLAVKWIIVGEPNVPIREHKNFFLKRYCLNESTTNEAIVINWDFSEVVQYKKDPNKYVYDGQEIHSINYPEIYQESSSIEHLGFENSELTIYGFTDRYNQWLKIKNSAFGKKIQALEERKRQEEEKNAKRINSLTPRTVTCEKCGRIALEFEFPSRIGNVGTCKNCMR